MMGTGSLVRRVLLAVAASAVVLFLGDFVSVWFQIPKRPQTRDLLVRPLLAIPAKGGKTLYELGLPETQTCSNSLFPQFGCPPCWWLERNRKQPVKI